MQMYTGFVTRKLQECKAFYTQNFGFETIYEAEWFVLLRKGPYELAFMQPEIPGQHRLFQPAFTQGIWLALEVEDVDAEYQRLVKSNAPIVAEPKNEQWGDRHFVIEDPNGMGVDVYMRLPVEEEQEM
ncbi:VOC family protein [Catalinimonas niigatensis]|uniref:VOC family protein n=1 Tax=Catalinimonas niigatensis TaxID=1397264 RepID=UPI002666E0B5|nr:VOC family protein [Catalinimonas niigatensis]WPP48563.1 VOC family protein [Catalinimonas niigatensis]